MCKLTKALMKGDFRAVATMQFSSNDVESILTKAIYHIFLSKTSKKIMTFLLKHKKKQQVFIPAVFF